MFAGLLGTLIDSVVKAAFSYFAGVMDKRGLIQQGQQIQAAATTTASEATEARMGQALADSPKTPNQALARLENGNA